MECRQPSFTAPKITKSASAQEMVCTSVQKGVKPKRAENTSNEQRRQSKYNLRDRNAPGAPSTASVVVPGDMSKAQAIHCTSVRKNVGFKRAKSTTNERHLQSRYELRNRNTLDAMSTTCSMVSSDVSRAQAMDCSGVQKDRKSKRTKSTRNGQRHQSKYYLRNRDAKCSAYSMFHLK